MLPNTRIVHQQTIHLNSLKLRDLIHLYNFTLKKRRKIWFLSTIQHRNVSVAQEPGLLKDIYNIQPGNICPSCSLSPSLPLFLAAELEWTYCTSFPFMKKWIMTEDLEMWQTHKQSDSGASVTRAVSAGSTANMRWN